MRFTPLALRNARPFALAAALCVPAGVALGPALAATPPPAPPAAKAVARPTAAPMDATALLRASIAAPRTVSYVGQLETLAFGSNRSNATIVRVEHRAPDRTRRWYLAPESLYGDYIVTSGNATYQFDTKHARMTVSHEAPPESAIGSDGNRLDLAMSNYRAVGAGAEIIASRPTQSVVLINRFTGERAERIWIDDETHLVLKKEAYHASGAVASQTRFEELRYTAQIPDDVFATAAPTGYATAQRPDVEMPSSDLQHVLKDAGFAVQTPRDLPQGFKLIGGDVATVPAAAGAKAGDVRSLHLVYSDGLRSLSLFENATGAAADFGSLHPKTTHFEDHDAEYVEDGPTTLLTWKEHGIHFALVGDLQRAELVQIGKSVIPGL